jgi:hypothetical protein
MHLPDLVPASYPCPYCGETNELLIDPTGGERQEFVEDCSVCCAPSTISVILNPGAGPVVNAEPES